MQSTDNEAPRCYGMQVRMTSRSLSRLYSKAMAPHGIEITEFSLLATFSRKPTVNLTQLAETLDLERTTLVRNAKRLAQKGLIAPCTRTGSGKNYIITTAGKKKLNAALPSWQMVQDRIAAELAATGGTNIAQLLNNLRNIEKPD